MLKICRYRLRPRVLRDVSKLDMSVSLLGKKVAFPICVAPTSMHRMAHHEGELATARGIKVWESNHVSMIVQISYCLL